MSSSGVKRKAPSTKHVKENSQKRRKPKGMPSFEAGEILVDLLKKKWRLGDLIGWGGFGALYFASPNVEKNVDDKATFVAKVEPHSNGPLFGELAFYQRVAKEQTLKTWLMSKKLKHVGVPQYIGSGSYEKDGKKYRFMIMERFGDDVEQIFLRSPHFFHIHTVLTLGIRIIDILECIHDHGYVHADIKGSNLMMGYVGAKNNQVYLLDYGLAYRFNPDGAHKEYKEDPKRRHDGTIEFTSRDAHKGVAPSPRTDLEILGYVLLHWLCGKLPWEDKLSDKDYVMNSKIKYMKNIPQLLKECLKGQKSDELEEYLKEVVKLDYDEKPDYNKLRRIFQNGLKKRRLTDDGVGVVFKDGETTTKLSNGHYEEDENGEESSSQEEVQPSPKRRQKVPIGKKAVPTSSRAKGSPVKRARSPQKAPVAATKSPGRASKRNETTAKTTATKDSKPASDAPATTKTTARRKRAAQEETPAAPVVKKTRGRPRKPILVDTATSP